MSRQKGFANNGVLMKYRNLREKVLAFEHYGGARCACCGTEEWDFLGLDHIDGGGNAERIDFFNDKSRCGHHMFRELRLRNYPAGYQVLCMNCDAGRSRNGGICPHKQKTLSGRERLEVFDGLRVGSDGSKRMRKVAIRPTAGKPRRKSPISPADILAGDSRYAGSEIELDS